MLYNLKVWSANPAPREKALVDDWRGDNPCVSLVPPWGQPFICRGDRGRAGREAVGRLLRGGCWEAAGRLLGEAPARFLGGCWDVLLGGSCEAAGRLLNDLESRNGNPGNVQQFSNPGYNNT